MTVQIGEGLDMLAYTLRRLGRLVVVLFGVSTVVFVTSRLTGDPATMIFGVTATEDQIQAYRHAMGWDLPLGLQYVRFLGSAAHLDFGTSFYYHQDALKLVLERMPATLELALAAMAIGVGVGIAAGILAGVNRNTWIDVVAMSGALAWRSVPVFWLALMLIFVFSVRLRLLPFMGREGLKSLILPAFSLGIIQAAETARVTRSAMVEVMSEDYIRTAYSKGLRRRAVVVRHALRNAMMPIVTVIGLQIGVLLGGAVITETIFTWPGVGSLTVDSILGRDFPVVQAAVFLLAAGFVLINVFLDLIYPLFDPRITHE
jgi:peptide/nickel transport system permease protein